MFTSEKEKLSREILSNSSFPNVLWAWTFSCLREICIVIHQCQSGTFEALKNAYLSVPKLFQI
jgi:hypothetical protein